MFNEDCTHLQTIAPQFPIPGMPSGVLFDRSPGTDTPCRLTWHEHRLCHIRGPEGILIGLTEEVR